MVSLLCGNTAIPVRVSIVSPLAPSSPPCSEAANIGQNKETPFYMEGVFPIVFHNMCLILKN